jgi:3-oxoacyl-[acyl-carrier protein] reductase
MINVTGRWAFVTGASRGIGYQIAHFMAERGCHLIIHSRTLKHTEVLETELLAKSVQVLRVAAELSEEVEVYKMLETIDAFGVDVDMVFNNAGLQIAYRKSYFDTPVSDFEISFKVNTIAPALICYHFLPQMIERGFGRIVNTTSGIKNEPEQAGYSASKAALEKITNDLASKINGTNVMLNLTDPGWCRTDLGGQYAPNDVKDSLPAVVLGAFLDDQKSGRIFEGPVFKGLSLEEALVRATEIL